MAVPDVPKVSTAAGRRLDDFKSMFEKYGSTFIKSCTLGTLILLLFLLLNSSLNNGKTCTDKIVASFEKHLEQAQHHDGVLLKAIRSIHPRQNSTIDLLVQTLSQLNKDNDKNVEEWSRNTTDRVVEVLHTLADSDKTIQDWVANSTLQTANLLGHLTKNITIPLVKALNMLNSEISCITVDGPAWASVSYEYGIWESKESCPYYYNCNTNYYKPQTGKPCTFPFKFDGQLYYKCTMKLLRNGIPWCPTKLNSDRKVDEYERYNWGYCGAKCH